MFALMFSGGRGGWLGWFLTRHMKVV
jgi:hypothetical protein